MRRRSPPHQLRHRTRLLLALQAQNLLSCLCADEMDVPIFDSSRYDVACGPILHSQNIFVKVSRVPSDRPVVVASTAEQSHPKHNTRVAVTGCTANTARARTAHSAVALTRRHVAGSRSLARTRFHAARSQLAPRSLVMICGFYW
jgi:hypothetical protein